MPQISEVRIGLEIGFTTAMKYMWVACRDCGKARWVQLWNGKPHCSLCRDCRNKRLRQMRGSKNRYWKGGITIHPMGYVCIYMPNHPHAYSNGYVPRSRLVLEGKLGRYLMDGTVPHHRNGNKLDDTPLNLEEKFNAIHARDHVARRRDGKGRFKAAC